MTEAQNPFILPAVLEVDALIEAFDDQDSERYGELFESADRVHLGALIAYASLAMRSLAERDGVPLQAIRRRIRSGVASAVAATQPKREEI